MNQSHFRLKQRFRRPQLGEVEGGVERFVRRFQGQGVFAPDRITPGQTRPHITTQRGLRLVDRRDFVRSRIGSGRRFRASRGVNDLKLSLIKRIQRLFIRFGDRASDLILPVDAALRFLLPRYRNGYIKSVAVLVRIDYAPLFPDPAGIHRRINKPRYADASVIGIV